MPGSLIMGLFTNCQIAPKRIVGGSRMVKRRSRVIKLLGGRER